MKNKEILDDIINAWLDGELDERHCNELKRLVENDPKAAKRLEELKRTRDIVASMPKESAPPALSENIKASLERSVLLSEYDNKRHRTLGAVHLFGRKMISAAAMLALLAVLGYVVMLVVSPAISRDKHVIPNTNWSLAEPKAVIEPSPVEEPAPISAAMRMELELATADYLAATEHIYKNAILANHLLETSTIDRQAGHTTYSISCTRADVNKILDSLEALWPMLAGSKLLIGPDSGAFEAIVGSITLEQIMQIVAQRTDGEQIKLAADFAALNAAEPNKPFIFETDANAIIPEFEQKSSFKRSASVEKISLAIKVIAVH